MVHTRPHPIPRPAADEYAPYYGRYIEQVTGDDAYAALAGQIDATLAALATLDEAGAAHRYAPEKWSVKQVIGHVIDAERVFAYRALRIGRGDTTPLPGFDEGVFAAAAASDARPLVALADELRLVRASTLALYGGFEAAALTRRGTASDCPVSVRALAWIMAGHERHHARILRERYGVGR